MMSAFSRICLFCLFSLAFFNAHQTFGEGEGARQVVLTDSMETAGFHLSVQAEVWRDGSWNAFRAGDTIRSGEHFRMFVAPESATYLYVIQYFANGSASVIYPTEGEYRSGANQRTRLPAPGKDFTLDETPGIERIFVIATSAPLDRSAPDVSKLIQDLREESATASISGLEDQSSQQVPNTVTSQGIGADARTGKQKQLAHEIPTDSATPEPNDSMTDKQWTSSSESAQPSSKTQSKAKPPSSEMGKSEQESGVSASKSPKSSKNKAKGDAVSLAPPRPTGLRPPPALITLASRSVIVADGIGGTSVKADEKGIAAYEFWLSHEHQGSSE